MQVKVKRMLIFLFGCIGTRCLLAYIAKVVNKMKEKQMALYSEFDREGDIKI